MHWDFTIIITFKRTSKLQAIRFFDFNCTLLTYISALDVAVALESLAAFADVVRRQVAALRVPHALRRKLGDGTLVDVL